MKTPRAVVLTLSLFQPGLTLADPVDETLVTTFQAGQPACAADVNQTIQALMAAVNDNAARVAELEAQLRQIQRPLDARVSGSTYTTYSYETGLGAYSSTESIPSPPTNIVATTTGKLGHWNFAETGTLVLNADGTLSLSFDSHEREVYMDTTALHDVDSPTVPEIYRVDLSTPIDDVEVGTIGGTWSINGQSLTLNIDGESPILVVSADGNILMRGVKELATAGPVNLLLSGMAMAVRTNPQNIAVESFEGAPIAHNGPAIQIVGPPNEPVTKSIRLLNLGDADLTSMSLELTGSDDFSIVKGLDAPTLAASGQVLITIQFADGPAQNIADLIIASDDPDTPSFQVQLSGAVQ